LDHLHNFKPRHCDSTDYPAIVDIAAKIQDSLQGKQRYGIRERRTTVGTFSVSTFSECTGSKDHRLPNESCLALKWEAPQGLQQTKSKLQRMT
jgi:hypothetical protein